MASNSTLGKIVFSQFQQLQEQLLRSSRVFTNVGNSSYHQWRTPVVQNVPGRLRREHSTRAFLTSCTGCLKYPKNWQDSIGGWSPGQSQGYVRTARRRIEVMQTKVATRLRAGGSAFFGERELEEDFMECLRQRQFPEELVQEQGKRLVKATRFITEENKKAADTEKGNGNISEGSEGSEVENEEEELEVSGEEGRTHVGQSGGWHLQRTSCTGRPARKKPKLIQVELARCQRKTLKRSLRSRKMGHFKGGNGDSRNVQQKTTLITSSSKVAKQPAGPKIPPLASSIEVQKQPASPKLLEAQLLKSKAAPIAISLAQSSQKEEKVKRTRRPKGILETRTRPSLKRYERSGAEPQEYVPPGFPLAYSYKFRCLHYVGRCWRKPGEPGFVPPLLLPCGLHRGNIQ